MYRTRVKICGITNVSDAEAAVDAGADAVGIIVYPPSPRNITESAAREIRAVIPAFVSLVLVSVNLDAGSLQHWIEICKPDILQFHGNETAEEALRFNLPYIKSVRMRDDVDMPEIESRYGSARALLMDTYVQGLVGGTGIAFDWSRSREVSEQNVILAGGLDVSTVAEAIKIARPFAIDVSSSLEASPGVKNHEAIREFMQAVHIADHKIQEV